MKKKVFSSVTIPVQDIERLREIAERERRSMAQQVSYLIEQHYLSRFVQESA